jgi:hypothetical protein
MQVMTPDMLAILTKAAVEGQVSITRTRDGVWPRHLRVIRALEQEAYLRRVGMHDDHATGLVTAVYELTDKGRKAGVPPMPGPASRR